MIFCVALSDYDKKMREDGETNRMQDSFRLFSSFVNSPQLKGCAFILFFNKTDLFDEKIKTTGLEVCFPEYKGGKNAQLAKEFLEQKFRSAKTKAKPSDDDGIYVKFTCATDKENIKHVFEAVDDFLNGEYLKIVI